MNNTKKKTIKTDNEQVEKGQKAIEAHEEIYHKNKSVEEKGKHDEKDAEKWHNEG